MDKKHIRNFCIIAHIDHGKSTLADRMLELTGTVDKRKMHDRFLDTMDLEQERGITIKLQPVRMNYTYGGADYILNLIDTPGHVDFTYEVSRALAACEGAILLVDATQGIQAQTLANLHLAEAQKLKIMPVVNKIDLVGAETQRVKEEISTLLKLPIDEILSISAKTGEGVGLVLGSIIDIFPPPEGNSNVPARALVFDSTYDRHRGVVAFIRLVDGTLKPGEKIFLMGERQETHILELGYFRPKYEKANQLETGEVGYIVTDFREVSKAKVGDTITTQTVAERTRTTAVVPLPGYREIKPMVYASFFASENSDFPKLRDSLGKLKLSDAALSFEVETVASIGTGFRCGFLGLLHLDIVAERLFREYDLDLLITSPTVAYKVRLRDGGEQMVRAAIEMPDLSKIESMQEPWVKLEIIAPSEYLGKIIDLVIKKRGIQETFEYGSERRTLLIFEAPLNNVIVDFYDKLKSVTSGYASMNYEFLEYRAADLVKLDVLVAGERVEAFSRIVHVSDAERQGRNILIKLKDLIPRHQFLVSLQALVGGKIIAREDVKAFRKDVTAKLYGGDDSRKKKLLEKQKKGKKRMKQFGKVSIPQETFIEIFKY
ncbi:MAG: translation elongation factor 4 [Patescibacteria group bacterium]